jgi:hypothetical protein
MYFALAAYGWPMYLLHNKAVPLHQVNDTDKKEKKIFLIYKEIQNGTVATSYIW